MVTTAPLAISIVSYNSAPVIGRCLETLHPYPVYILDNNSTDGTAALLKTQYPWVRVEESTVNLGFGNGHNRILSALPEEMVYALVLNPDCFISAAALERLLQTAAARPDAALLGPAYSDISHAYDPAQGEVSVPFLSGACLLLRLEVFRRIGFFDPHIFLFYEDNELCDRVRAAGYTALFEPRAIVTHIGAASTPPSIRGVWRRQKAMGRSYAYYQKKRGKSRFSRYASPLRKVLRGLRALVCGDRLEAVGCLAHAVGSVGFWLRG